MTKTTTTPSKISAQIIEVKTWKGTQSVHFRKIMKLNDYKIKIEIKRDSYDNQSSAVGYFFNPTKMEWVVVYSIPYPEIKTNSGHIYRNDAIVSTMFTDDSVAVLKGITSILF